MDGNFLTLTTSTSAPESVVHHWGKRNMNIMSMNQSDYSHSHSHSSAYVSASKFSSSQIFPDDDDPGYLLSPSSSSISPNVSLYGDEDIPLDDEQFSLAFQVCIYILYNTVFISAVLGNVLVCYVVFSSPRMKTVTNYLIANLALGDLLMAVLCVPFSYIPVLYQYWPFGQILCHVVSPAQAVCVFVSAYTLVALAGDRYMAILYPLKPRLRRSQAVIVIFIVWAIAILTAAPVAVTTRLYQDNVTLHNGNYIILPRCGETWVNDQYKLYYSLILMILQYFFPLAVLVFTYTRIALAVWGKKAPGEAEDGRDQRLAKAKRKMIKMMLTVVIVYTVSWLPFNTLIVCSDIQGEKFWGWDPIKYIFFMLHWLAMSHTVCNPIIYCWMNSRFRAGFRQAVSKLPIIKKALAGRNLSDYEYRLQRMGTCTTYTFAPNGKIARGSSLASNRTTYSDAMSYQHNSTINHNHNHSSNHNHSNHHDDTSPTSAAKVNCNSFKMSGTCPPPRHSPSSSISSSNGPSASIISTVLANGSGGTGRFSRLNHNNNGPSPSLPLNIVVSVNSRNNLRKDSLSESFM